MLRCRDTTSSRWPGKNKYPRFFGVLLTEADHDLLLEYKRANGHSTKSAAAREMMRRQGHYARWKRSRYVKQGTEEELRKIAREILQEHPDASKGALG